MRCTPLIPLLCCWSLPRLEASHTAWHFQAQGQASALFYHHPYGFCGIENQLTHFGESLWEVRYGSHLFDLSHLGFQFHFKSTLGRLSKGALTFGLTAWTPLGLAELSFTLQAWGMRLKRCQAHGSPCSALQLPPPLMMSGERRSTFIQYGPFPPSPEKTSSRSRPPRPPLKAPSGGHQATRTPLPRTSTAPSEPNEKAAFSEFSPTGYGKHRPEPKIPRYSPSLSFPLKAMNPPPDPAPSAMAAKLCRDPSPWALNVSTMSVLDSVISLANGSPILRCSSQKADPSHFAGPSTPLSSPCGRAEDQQRSRPQQEDKPRQTGKEPPVDSLHSLNPQLLMELLKPHGIDLIMHPWSHMLESYLRLLRELKPRYFNELEVNQRMRWILEGVLGEGSSLNAYFIGRTHPWMKENIKHSGVILASIAKSPLPELNQSALLSRAQLGQWRSNPAYQQATLWFYFLSWQAPIALQQGTESLRQWGASKTHAIQAMEQEVFPPQAPWSWKRIRGSLEQAMQRFQSALIRIERSEGKSLGLSQAFEAHQAMHQRLRKMGEEYEVKITFRPSSFDKGFPTINAALLHHVHELTSLNLEACALISRFLGHLSAQGVPHHDLALRLWIGHAPALERLLADPASWNEALQAWSSHEKMLLCRDSNQTEAAVASHDFGKSLKHQPWRSVPSHLQSCTLWISQLRQIQNSGETSDWKPLSEGEWLEGQGLDSPLTAYQSLMRQLEALRHGWKDFLVYGEFQAMFLGIATSKASAPSDTCGVHAKALRNYRATVMEWDERFDAFFMRAQKRFNFELWGEEKPKARLTRSLTGPTTPQASSTQTNNPRVRTSQTRADSMNPPRSNLRVYQRGMRLR